MRKRILVAICCLILPAFALTTAWPREQAAKEKQAVADGKLEYSKDLLPILKKYCNDCHGGEKPKGGLDLSQFKTTDLAENPKHKHIWENVIAQIRAGEMPPTGKPPLDIDQKDILYKVINSQFLSFDCTGGRDPGRVNPYHRMNKDEYNNTIRDLLGVRAVYADSNKGRELRPADDFPDDDVSGTFDNNADVLSLSPLLMEKYFAAAEKIVEQVFNNPQLRSKVIAFRLPGEKLPGDDEGGGKGGKGGGKGGKGDKGAPPAKEQPAAKPAAKPTTAENEAAFKKVMGPFLKRAFRRDIPAEEMTRFTKFVALAEKNGDGAEKAIQLAMQAALCSPQFLFRIEKDFVIKDGVTTQKVSDFELASRLSYFLWSSMPDDELLTAAANGKLRDKATLEAQVKRMIKDARSDTIANRFAGQWLQLRTVARLTPDPKAFPAWNDKLAFAMVKETETFLTFLMREDRNVLEMIDADYTFLNERLAKHYGMTGVKGEDFRKVPLAGDQRLGMLTHASILSVTSNPTRTSPTKRGKWILDNVLNTPPPPPPPDVPDLEDTGDNSKKSLREQMEIHRTNPACASCHNRMDPLGFGLENYDAIGAWRTKDGTWDIDPAGQLPNGTKFATPKELVKIVKSKDVEFRRCMVEKLLEYSLGRTLHVYDNCAVDDICAEMTRNNDRFFVMIMGVVNSDPFQKRKGTTAAKAAP